MCSSSPPWFWERPRWHTARPRRSGAPGGPAPAAGPAPTKIAIINITGAILGTKDGQVAASALQARFAPRQQELQKKQTEIAALREQLSKGSATMSQEAKDKLMRDIDTNTKALNRDTEDAQADLDQEQGKVQQDLGGKVMAIIDQYAPKNGFAVVLDVSNPQTSGAVGGLGGGNHRATS